MAMTRNNGDGALLVAAIDGKRTVSGMSTLEYVALVTVAVAALVGMSMYLKRGLEGKWRSVGDTFGFGKQYDPSR